MWNDARVKLHNEQEPQRLRYIKGQERQRNCKRKGGRQKDTANNDGATSFGDRPALCSLPIECLYVVFAGGVARLQHALPALVRGSKVQKRYAVGVHQNGAKRQKSRSSQQRSDKGRRCEPWSGSWLRVLGEARCWREKMQAPVWFPGCQRRMAQSFPPQRPLHPAN